MTRVKEEFKEEDYEAQRWSIQKIHLREFSSTVSIREYSVINQTFSQAIQLVSQPVATDICFQIFFLIVIFGLVDVLKDVFVYI